MTEFNERKTKFDQKLEAALAMLSYYTMEEEIEMMENADYQSNIKNSLKIFDTSQLILELILIPIVCTC